MGANDDDETNFPRLPQLDRNHSPSSRLLSFLVCKEFFHLFETMSIDGLSHDRLHSSVILFPLRLENYSKYFILSIALFHQVSKKYRHFYLLSRRSLSPFFSVASTPVPGVFSAGLSPRVAPAPGSVNPALLSAVTLRSSAVLLNSSLLGGNLNSSAPLIPFHIKITLSHRVPGLMTEDLPLGLLGIHSLSVFSMVPNQVIGEVVLDGGGRFSPAGIVGVHTLSLFISSQAAHDCAAGNTI